MPDENAEQITAAFAALKAARVDKERNPSAANIRKVDERQAELDLLLDLRFARVPATIGAQKQLDV